MMTRFVTVEVNLQPSPAETRRSILTELQKWGEPLRWAITAVNSDRQTAQVEAVVTQTLDFLIPDTCITTV
jgi:hypothetical protein